MFIFSIVIKFLYRITKDPSNSELLYCQRISSTPATRLDVINLQEQLDMRLQQRQARETGICPVRRELFSQCFGKIIFPKSFIELFFFSRT